MSGESQTEQKFSRVRGQLSDLVRGNEGSLRHILRNLYSDKVNE